MTGKLLIALSALLTAAAFAAVDVNEADQAALETIKGIGPTVSAKIIDERRKGAFKDWTDLVGRVGGIGAGNAAKLSAQGLTVDGSPFKRASTRAEPAAAKQAAASREAPSARPEDRNASATK